MTQQYPHGRDNRQQPQTGATGTPTHHQPGHDFTLQTIMELQKSVGSLESEIKGLREAQTNTLNRTEKACDKLESVDKKLYAAGIVLVIVLGIAGWMLNVAYDLSKDTLKAVVTQQMASETTSNNKPE
ncbi:hypothetical protein [Idiomarina aminovorans]|uniref:hypothetical protein n=1 Tax=Idiomarina aminovorans TaxID=2914829 RepID=UPI0020055A83|nr:hypothetical protein [Idiomarina sp. ATCH4]MCK7458473.1 hypothetical protein [Idiomarina sp. ATCH4]